MIKLLLLWQIFQYSDSLNISQCHFERHEPIDYRKYDFESYRYVNLSCGGLTTLQGTNFSKVVSLNLSNNQLTSLDGIKLDSLESIDISNTNIKNLNALCSCKNLKSITYENDLLSEIPPCLFSNTKLEILNIVGVKWPLGVSIDDGLRLRNLSLTMTNDSLLNNAMIDRINQLTSLAHLQLINAKRLLLSIQSKRRIESLSLIVKDSNMKNVLLDLRDFSNLRELEIVTDSKKFNYDLRFLHTIEVLIVRRFSGNQMVLMPDYLNELNKLKSVYDFVNLKNYQLKREIKIISGPNSNLALLKKMRYSVVEYSNTFFIKN